MSVFLQVRRPKCQKIITKSEFFSNWAVLGTMGEEAASKRDFHKRASEDDSVVEEICAFHTHTKGRHNWRDSR